MAAKKKKPPRPSGPAFKPASFIASRPIFRFDEFLEAHDASGATRQTTAALLRYHVATGRLRNLRRGLYAQPGELDPWVLGSRLSSDAVIAYDGALSFYGLGPLDYSLSFLTQQRVASFVFDEIDYRPIREPESPHKSDRGGFIDEVERAGQKFKVTSRARTLVDCLDRLDLGPGPRKMWDAFNQGLPYDPDDLVAYAKRLGSRITAARLGFFLERMGARPALLKALEPLCPTSPAYFERGPRKSRQHYFARWKLVVSQRLIDHVEATHPLESWKRDRPEEE